MDHGIFRWLSDLSILCRIRAVELSLVMMTTLHVTFSILLALCVGNPWGSNTKEWWFLGWYPGWYFDKQSWSCDPIITMNMVNFPWNTHNRRPIACSTGSVLFVRYEFKSVLPETQQYCMQCCVIKDLVIMECYMVLVLSWFCTSRLWQAVITLTSHSPAWDNDLYI